MVVESRTTFEAERVRLIDALLRVAPADAVADAAPFAGDVWVSVSGSALKLRMREPSFISTARCTASVAEPGKFLVGYRRILDFARKFTGEIVRAQLRSDGLALVSGKDRAVLRVKDPTGYPTQVRSDNVALRLPMRTMRTVLRSVAHAMHEDFTRPMSCATLIVENGVIRASATDAMRFAICKTRVDDVASVAKIVLPSRLARKIAVLSADDDAAFEVGTDASHIFVCVDDLFITASKLQTETPELPWDDIRPGSSCATSRDAFAHAIDVAFVDSGGGGGAIRLDLETNRLVVSAHGADVEARAPVHLDEVHGPKASVIVGAKFLKDAIAQQGERLEIGFVAEPAVVILRSAASHGAHALSVLTTMQ